MFAIGGVSTNDLNNKIKQDKEISDKGQWGVRDQISQHYDIMRFGWRRQKLDDDGWGST